MKLEKYVDKSKKKRKVVLISLGVIVLISVSLLLYKTFASFTESAEFQVMKGKVDYFGNSDIYFAFYKGDEQLDEMPGKDNEENLVFDHGECDNGASILWNESEWAPLVKGLNKVKTKCSLYFKLDPFINAGTLRTINSSDFNGMWRYKGSLKQIVIENTKSEKQAPDGGQLYGPFDESIDKDSKVQSYVVCESGDINCVGYLQGEGGINASNNSSYLFANFTNVDEIKGLENLNTSNVTNMSNMFYNLKQLQNLDISSFDTSNVTNMYGMFQDSSINNIIFSNNFGESATDMTFMFARCTINEMDMSTFNVKDYANLNGIFSSATIKSLNLSNWKLDSTFFNNNLIEKAENLIVKNVDTSSFTDMRELFSHTKITKLDLSDFDTENVTNMSGMFSWTDNLQEIIFPNNFGSKVTSMNEMFYYAISLENLDLSMWDTSSSTDMYEMFNNCKSLKSINISSFDTHDVSNMYRMFADSPMLDTIIFGPKFVHKVGAEISGMFSGCPAPERPTDSSWQGVSF